jgi:hypothetical protein
MHTTPATAWTAKLILPPMTAPSSTPLSVMVRVVYNTLEGIVNDYFVVTASVAVR